MYIPHYCMSSKPRAVAHCWFLRAADYTISIVAHPPKLASLTPIILGVVSAVAITSIAILAYVNSLYPLSQLRDAKAEVDKSSSRQAELREAEAEIERLGTLLSQIKDGPKIFQLRSRLQDAVADRDYLAEQLRNTEIRWCAGRDQPVSNTELLLEPLGNRFAISSASVTPYLGQLLQTEAQPTIAKIGLNLFGELANVNLMNLERMSVENTGPSSFVVSATQAYEDETFAADFVFKIEFDDDTTPGCNLPVRLHFSQKLEDSLPGYRTTRVIGRSGQGFGLFSLPYGTEFFGRLIFVSDCSNENVSLFSSDGEFFGAFSEFGSRMGKLDTPADIKVFNDKIYVVEELNHRVQVFDLNGAAVDIFGAYEESEDDPGAFIDKFNHPLGIAISDDQIAIVDYGNNRILGYDHNWNYRWVSGNSSEDETFEWVSPYYIEYSRQSDLFVVSNRKADELALISPSGEKLRTLGTDMLRRPHEVAIDPDGNILVADYGNYRLVKFLIESDFAEYHAIQFPKSFGLPKTVAVNETGEIALGFVGNGLAYFLLFTPESDGTQTEDSFWESPFDEQLWIGAFESFGSRSDTTQHAPRSAARVYSQYCSQCHEGGRYGAPSRGNMEAWEKFPKDLSKLLQLAKAGKGAMIPNGGCLDCTDELLVETIQFMLPMSWELKAGS